MTQLRINSEYADLDQDYSMTLVQEIDITNLDFVEPSYSYTFDLPATAHNKRIFKFSNILQRFDLRLKTYPAEIVFQGNILKAGEFVLESYDRKTDSFKGFLRADMSVFAKYRDLSIREIIGEDTFDGYYLPTLPSENATKYCFPVIKAGSFIYNRLETDVVGEQDTGFFIPYFYLHFITTLIFNKLGYLPKNADWYEQKTDFHKVILDNTYSIGAIDNTVTPKEIRNHVPNMTLGNWLNGLQRTFGLCFLANPIYKQIRILFIENILNDFSQYVEKTLDSSPHYKLENDQYEGLTFRFSEPKEQTITESMVAGTSNMVAALPPASAANINKIRYIRNANQYWKNAVLSKKENEMLVIRYEWQKVGEEIFPKKIDEGKKSIDSPFGTVPKTDWLVFEIETNGFALNNDGGRVYLLCSDAELAVIKRDYLKPIEIQIAFTDSYSREYTDRGTGYKHDEWYKIHRYHTDGLGWRWVVLDTPYSGQLEWGYIKIRYKMPYYLPEYESNNLITNRKTNVLVEPTEETIDTMDFAPRLMLYHGLFQTNTTPPLTIPYASADNYDWLGNRINAFSLKWNGKDTLFDNFFKRYADFVKNRVKISYAQLLSASELRNFDVTVPQRIKEVFFWVVKIQTVLKRHSVEPSQINAYLINAKILESGGGNTTCFSAYYSFSANIFVTSYLTGESQVVLEDLFIGFGGIRHVAYNPDEPYTLYGFSQPDPLNYYDFSLHKYDLETQTRSLVKANVTGATYGGGWTFTMAGDSLVLLADNVIFFVNPADGIITDTIIAPYNQTFAASCVTYNSFENSLVIFAQTPGYVNLYDMTVYRYFISTETFEIIYAFANPGGISTIFTGAIMYDANTILAALYGTNNDAAYEAYTYPDFEPTAIPAKLTRRDHLRSAQFFCFVPPEVVPPEPEEPTTCQNPDSLNYGQVGTCINFIQSAGYLKFPLYEQVYQGVNQGKYVGLRMFATDLSEPEANLPRLGFGTINDYRDDFNIPRVQWWVGTTVGNMTSTTPANPLALLNTANSIRAMRAMVTRDDGGYSDAIGVLETNANAERQAAISARVWVDAYAQSTGLRIHWITYIQLQNITNFSAELGTSYLKIFKNEVQVRNENVPSTYEFDTVNQYIFYNDLTAGTYRVRLEFQVRDLRDNSTPTIYNEFTYRIL